MNRAAVDEWVENTGEEPLLFTGFDDAIIGFGYQFSNPLVIYSHEKMIDIIMEDGGTYEEAIEQFRQNYLSSDQNINFDVDAPDLSDILGPPGILSAWDPSKNPVTAVFSTGWGPEGQDEAFLIIIQKPDGSHAWDGIVVASGSYGGFEGLYNQPN